MDNVWFEVLKCEPIFFNSRHDDVGICTQRWEVFQRKAIFSEFVHRFLEFCWNWFR